ncbi:MAG: hypothetical protein L6455_10490 [Kiritimatiellae bacterium]|nr:hypothetical protein [Verrucomicrobiota bacterium]MCG2680377.1 hypothetical protein [Kiritimatiellia bacterium]
METTTTATSPAPLDAGRRNQLLALYRDGLLNDTLLFWINHAVDWKCGGFFFCLNRDGTDMDAVAEISMFHIVPKLEPASLRVLRGKSSISIIPCHSRFIIQQ